MSTPTGPHSRPPWMAIAIVVALLIVGANVIGYLVFRDRPEPAPTAAAAAPTPEAPALVAEPPATTSRNELALQQREQGIARLRDGEHHRARILFENAQQLDPEVADIEDLLQLADRLGGAESPTPVVVRPAPEAARVASRRSPPRSRRPRPAAQRSEPARTAPAASGRLIVVTEPPQLLIEVDGRPSALTPADLMLPPGEHRVVLRRGRDTLETRTVAIVAGRAETLELDLRAKIVEATPAPREGGIEGDDQLDLLALVGRDEVKPTEAARAASMTAPEPTKAGLQPQIFVVWPGATRRDLSRALGGSLAGVPVQVVSSTSELELTSNASLAVLGRPGALRSAGLSAAWRAAMRTPEQYLAVSLKPVGQADLLKRTLGIANRGSGRQASLFVGRLLGTEAPPKVRRVDAVEDLMSMLQLSVVDLVLVPKNDLARLQARTQQTLHTLEIAASQPELAVAFVGKDQDARASLELALESISPETQRALGIRSWIR